MDIAFVKLTLSGKLFYLIHTIYNNSKFGMSVTLTTCWSHDHLLVTWSAAPQELLCWCNSLYIFCHKVALCLKLEALIDVFQYNAGTLYW